MSKTTAQLRVCLEDILCEIGDVAVALSGGIDSMVLSAISHSLLSCGKLRSCTMFHAVSPAVAEESTARVITTAKRLGWGLRIVDAAEFEDAEYVANPVNRCFFCKTSLYRTITNLTSACVVSGTNSDDLSDYRPGLDAAKNFSVRHPYVEAQICKSTIRQLAHEYGLAQFADLPASPCLSSRVETGISIVPSELRLIESVEQFVAKTFSCKLVRCRLRAEGIDVQVDETTLVKIREQSEFAKGVITSLLSGRFANASIQYSPYKMGSAFLIEGK